MDEISIVGVVTFEEFQRLLRARLKYRLGHFDEFVRIDAFERRLCRLGDVWRCGAPNWRTTPGAGEDGRRGRA